MSVVHQLNDPIEVTDRKTCLTFIEPLTTKVYNKNLVLNICHTGQKCQLVGAVLEPAISRRPGNHPTFFNLRFHQMEHNKNGKHNIQYYLNELIQIFFMSQI